MNCIVWFRQDLRLADNPALHAARQSGARIIPLYIHSPEEHGPWAPGAASNWWLHHSLRSLQAELNKRGSRLILRRGNSARILQQMVQQQGCSAVYWNALYEPDLVKRDNQVRDTLTRNNVRVYTFNGSVLNTPGTILNQTNQPYRVFTPFYQRCLQAGLPTAPLPRPRTLAPVNAAVGSDALESFALLPTIAWDQGMCDHWQAGESAAHRQLDITVGSVLIDYPRQRDLPAAPGTSRLSPYLHFGELGPRQVFHAVSQAMTHVQQGGVHKGGEALLRQIFWRDFACHLLFHFPRTTNEPMDPRFRNFPWNRKGGARLRAWQQGRTGIPMVDAGMRELWHTGWMHNRVRMIVASLLVKNLGVHWLQGARWFWDTLVDADLACNSLNWQWVAGCGADAAPYFRVFNPWRQGEKFDPQASYIKQWLPELCSVPAKDCHHPERLHAGLNDSSIYPAPIIDTQQSRQQALALYRSHMQQR